MSDRHTEELARWLAARLQACAEDLEAHRQQYLKDKHTDPDRARKHRTATRHIAVIIRNLKNR